MGYKIVIADDEPNIVVTLEFLLEQEGYDFVVARDGKEALDQVEAFDPDLILLDIMLPEINGYEVCQKLRENPKFKNLKIILLTAKGRQVEIAKGLALGADAYITKPFSTKNLVQEIRTLLEQEA